MKNKPRIVLDTLEGGVLVRSDGVVLESENDVIDLRIVLVTQYWLLCGKIME